MLGQAFPHRQTPGDRNILQRPDVAWGRRRWCSDDVFEYPAAANDWRSAGRVRGDSENTSVPQQSAPFTFGGGGHATETIAIDVGNSVMFGETFVQECVIGFQQLEDAV